MPRDVNAVKIKRKVNSKLILNSPKTGMVDSHFHGAYGVDFMDSALYSTTIGQRNLKTLCSKLGLAGIAGFFPTTFSAKIQKLIPVVRGLGAWIHESQKQNFSSYAKPLGIHLEGPFISSKASGAHPTQSLEKYDFKKLETLWNESRHTIKIITLAPESLSYQELKKLGLWAEKNGVTLSIGHSTAGTRMSEIAFDTGFTRVTHAWNAMPFHHREPGILAAAFKRKEITLEIIPDGHHVSYDVIDWTLKLHRGLFHFVSDATPAVGCPYKKWVRFGAIKASVPKAGSASITQDGTLAGGGELLPAMISRLFKTLKLSLELKNKILASCHCKNLL